MTRPDDRETGWSQRLEKRVVHEIQAGRTVQQENTESVLYAIEPESGLLYRSNDTEPNGTLRAVLHGSILITRLFVPGAMRYHRRMF